MDFISTEYEPGSKFIYLNTTKCSYIHGNIYFKVVYDIWLQKANL